MTTDKISDTALRIGMICGLLAGIDREACSHLIKNESGDFRYIEETKAVLQLHQTIWGRK